MTASQHTTLRGFALTKYGLRAAGTRQRFRQMLPYLAEENIDIDFSHLFDDDYLVQLFDHQKRPLLTMLKAYGRRLKEILRPNDYDFFWVHMELLPYFPGWAEALIHRSGKPVIYEFDDALFHQYDLHRNPLIRALLGKKLQPLLRGASLAVCGNRYLQAYAEQFCPNTIIVPTVVDCTQYEPAASHSAESPVIGWMGSPSTWTYVTPMLPLLEEILTGEGAQLLAVGTGQHTTPSPSLQFQPWSEPQEVPQLQSMDIGIMPLPNDPWAQGKCGYKLIQYMACGLPVVASPVGVNAEIVEEGVNGFLASTPEEWRRALQTLLRDPELRRKMGAKGRQKIVAQYSLQAQGPILAKAIRMAVEPTL